jgi:two-component system, OmpR family, sensor histidine kinase KdpD
VNARESPPGILRRSARSRPLAVWLLALAGAVAILLPLRGLLEESHVALLLLLVTLGGSAAAGRMVGWTLAVASFLALNWFFLPPFHTFVVADPLDWLVLVVFLITSAVAAQLLYVAQEEARVAHARAAEIDRLRIVGAEALNAGRAEDALATVARVIRETAQADRCDVLPSATRHAPAAAESAGASLDNAPDHAVVQWVVENGNATVERRDGLHHLSAARPSQGDLHSLASGEVLTLFLPLSVRDRVVGVLRLQAPRGLRLDAERWRFVDALSYYAALGVERVRLVAAEEHAEALRETNRLKDALLASVSHDLRTPLTTIKARAHELRVHGDERAEIIEQEADRLNRLVADLLDLSRLNARVLPVTLELNAVDELVELVVQRVEGALEGRSLLVRLAPDGELLFGRFDLAHSVRILVNVVENAHRYSPPNVPIEITAGRAAGELVIEVADRGAGLGDDEVERVFEPFYRGPSAPPHLGGTGLGLPIAKRLAEAQGGALRYAPRPGGGSVFALTLPAVQSSDTMPNF